MGISRTACYGRQSDRAQADIVCLRFPEPAQDLLVPLQYTMGDPLSIPAGVVGMVSLGIQLCQSLYTYCNNVQERTRDIKIVSDQIKSLESTFRSLATVVQRIISLPHASGTMISSLNHCVAACEGGLQELQEFVAPIDDIGGEGFKNKMQGVGKKMAFGFRRGELSTLQQKVHALTTTVGLAVQTLTL